MQTIRVIAGEQVYYLNPRADVAELRGAVVTAMRSGGDIVDFVDVSGREIAITVSPGMQLTFETVELHDEPHDPRPSEERSISYDFDF